MERRNALGMLGLGVLGAGWPALGRAADGEYPLSVVASFGAGLNTLVPGVSTAANHRIIPRRIEVGRGGVVNFMVAGFHQIMIYRPGKKARDVILPADPNALFVDDINGLYYRGIVPASTPNVADTNPSNAMNRVEPVSFAQTGVHLVICNVRRHFLEGMFAYVHVR